MAKNFISSKYALAVGDVVKELISIFPYIKTEFEGRVVKRIKEEGKFDVDKDGVAFQYFCYSLFKDYRQIIPTDEASSNVISNDFVIESVPGIEFEIKNKANGSNIQQKFKLFDSIVLDILSKERYEGKFYVNLTFSGIEIDSIEKNVIARIRFYLLELLKKVNSVDYSLLAEDIEGDNSVFCLIRIHYQPVNMHFNDYWIGRDVAGFFADGHNIAGKGGYAFSAGYLDLSLECYIEGWINKKFANCDGVLFFSARESVYDDISLRKAFSVVNQKYPNFIGMVYVDLWGADPDKLATVKVFYKDEGRLDSLLNEFDERKVRLVFEKC
ncbi:hypothetical protein [Minisyncoccus archaeiphilus]|uniref:hypothetical protein n=1 Tax=Minisyncoccus archaeiphilus TaxID=3238481 RepID=UPI00399C5DD1